MGKKIILSLLVLLILCCSTAIVAFMYWSNSSKNFLLNNTVTKEVHIEKGHSYGQLYDELFAGVNTPPYFIYKKG